MGRESLDTRDRIIVTAQRIMSRRGYSAVGINEVLAEARVPKGSFYHYFSSKDAFGEAVMATYFDNYLSDMSEIISRSDESGAARLMAYWRYWYDVETNNTDAPKCLAVKLGAEVADLSEPMRHSLQQGTSAVIDNIAAMIETGVKDSSLSSPFPSIFTARVLYDLWLGASVRTKIERDTAPLDDALLRTRELLQIPDDLSLGNARC